MYMYLMTNKYYKYSIRFLAFQVGSGLALCLGPSSFFCEKCVDTLIFKPLFLLPEVHKGYGGASGIVNGDFFQYREILWCVLPLD